VLHPDHKSGSLVYSTLYNFALTCKLTNKLVNNLPYFLYIREGHQSKFFSGENTKSIKNIKIYLTSKNLLKPIPHLIVLITIPGLEITEEEDDLISFTLKLLEHTYPLQYQLLHTLNEKRKKHNITYRYIITQAIKADKEFQELNKVYVINLLLKIFGWQQCATILLNLFHNTHFSDKNNAKRNFQKAIMKLFQSIPVDEFPEAIELFSKYQDVEQKLCSLLIYRLHSKNLFEKIKLFAKIHTELLSEQIRNLMRRTKYDEKITITKEAISMLNNNPPKITEIATIIACIAIQYLKPENLIEINTTLGSSQSKNILVIKNHTHHLLNQHKTKKYIIQQFELLQSDQNYNADMLFNYLANNLQNKDSWIVKISIAALTRLATLNESLIPKIWNRLFPLFRKKTFFPLLRKKLMVLAILSKK